MDPGSLTALGQAGVGVVALAVLWGFYKALAGGVIVLGRSVEAEREVWRARIEDDAARIATLENALRLLSKSQRDQGLPALRDTIDVASESVDVLKRVTERMEDVLDIAKRVG